MKRRDFLALSLAAPVLPPTAAAAAELRVRTDFPGGSAKVEGIDQESRTIRLTPTPHPDRGWACWWYFKLEGLKPGETVTLDVGTDSFAKPDRAMFSLDDRTWTHTAPGERQGNRIVYRHRVEQPAMWFAWGPPFVLKDAEALVRRLAAKSPHFSEFELCKSADGRSVPALRIHEPGPEDAPRYGIWVQARQHAWESGGSWVGRGLAEWAASDDPRAVALRKKATIYFVPIMDVDNVERGAGGKNQKPHDHNRDWSDNPHHPAVRAAIKQITALDAVRGLDFFLDLHNPAPGDRQPEFFLTPREFLSPQGLRNMDAFLAAAREEIRGPLTYRGKTRETGPAYDRNWERISGNWVSRNTHGHVVSVCLETPWNTPQSTQEGYLQIGRELGRAIERYFRADVRAPVAP